MDDSTEIKAGDWFVGVRCKHCEAIGFLARDHTRGGVRFTGEGTMRITCHQCGQTSDYQPDEIERFVAEAEH